MLAGFLTAMPLLLLWLLSWNEAANAQIAMPIVQALSLFNHFQPFAVGLVEAARRLLLRDARGHLRLGDAPGAGGATVARAALSGRRTAAPRDRRGCPR